MKKHIRLKKEDFNAGTPYSSWLKEELLGEVYNPSMGFKNRGLVKKYKVYVDDDTEGVIMGISKLDDLPKDLKKIAVDIIRIELDKDFKA